MTKRVLSFILCMVMLFALLPAAAFADGEPTVISSGKCSDTVTWTYYSGRVLVIEGSGSIPKYTKNDQPWNSVQPLSIVIGEGITGIGEKAFYSSTATSVSLPSTLVTIGESAFASSALKSVTIPDSVKVIPKKAFYLCSSLETVNFGKGVTDIKDDAFEGCSIPHVIIPDSVVNVGNTAFPSTAKYLTIGKNVKSIGTWLPGDLTTIYYAGTKTQIKQIKGINQFDEFNEEPMIWKYNHTHNYTVKVVEPTCTEQGYTLHTCSHGDSYKTEYKSSLGHDVRTVNGYPATYDSEGLTNGKVCDRCGKVITKQKVIPKLVDEIVSVTLKDLDAPVVGQKLDYEVSVESYPAGRIVTGGENAPMVMWFVFNEKTHDFDPISDPDHLVAETRAYLATVVVAPAEHCAFPTANGTFNTIELEEMDSSKISGVEGVLVDGILAAGVVFPMKKYDSSHTVSKLVYSELPTYYVTGDKVANFRGAKLKNDGKNCQYVWYLEKYNSKNEPVGMYVSESMTSKFLALDPSFTKADIAQMRKDFGATFSKSYSYVMHNIQILDADYAYKNGTVKLEIDAIGVGYYESVFNNSSSAEPISDFMVHLNRMTVTKPDKPDITSGDVGKGQILWDPVPGADKYEVFRSTDGKSYKSLGMTASLEYTDTSAVSGKTYYYKIRAVNVTDSTTYYSSYSNTRVITIAVAPKLKLELSGGSVKLSWAKVEGVSKYEIYRSTDGGKSYSKLATTSGTSYTDSSAKKGSTYYYKVRSVVKVGNGTEKSSFCSAKSVTVLKAPTVTLTKSDGKVKLSWKAISGAAKYKVYRSTDNKSFKLLTTTSKLSYTNSSVTSGTKYYYKVRAVDAAGGTSAYSSVKSGVPIATPTLTAKLSGTSVKLSWAKVTGATKYEIYRSTDGGKTYKLLKTVTGTSYTNEKLTKGSTYYYKVRAVKVSGSTTYAGSYSAAQSVMVLKAPSITVGTDSNKIKLSWKAVSGAVKYEVYRSTDNKTFKRLTTTSKLSYTNSSVKTETTYYYKVRAVDENGGVGAYSSVKKALIAGPLDAPVIRATQTSKGVKLTWDPVKNADKYEIYIAPMGQENGYVLHDTVTGCSYVSDLSYMCYYKVVAVRTVGNEVYTSYYSNWEFI